MLWCSRGAGTGRGGLSAWLFVQVWARRAGHKERPFACYGAVVVFGARAQRREKLETTGPMDGWF